MQIRFDGKKHIFGKFYSGWGPILGWHKHQRCIVKISWLWPSTVCSIFTAIQAKYTHLDTSIPVLQQLQPWMDTFVQLILRNNLKSFFHKLLRNFSVFFCFVDPVAPPPPLDPECHFDMLCECARNIYWQKGMLGHGREHTQKLTTGH